MVNFPSQNCSKENWGDWLDLCLEFWARMAQLWLLSLMEKLREEKILLIGKFFNLKISLTKQLPWEWKILLSMKTIFSKFVLICAWSKTLLDFSTSVLKSFLSHLKLETIFTVIFTLSWYIMPWINSTKRMLWWSIVFANQNGLPTWYLALAVPSVLSMVIFIKTALNKKIRESVAKFA